MYALRFVDHALRCSLCRAEIAGSGFVGHYYEQPLCGGCFAEADPVVAEAWNALSNGAGESLHEIGDPSARCGSCSEPVESWVAGRSGQTLLCRKCLGQRAPQLAAILILDQGVRRWKAQKGRAAEVALLADVYGSFFEGR